MKSFRIILLGAIQMGLLIVVIRLGLSDNVQAKVASTSVSATSSNTSKNIQQQLDQQYTHKVLPIMKQHCFRCHGPNKKRGGVTLHKFKSMADLPRFRQDWIDVKKNLHNRFMPPDDEPQPTPGQIDTVTKWIADALDYCDCSGPRNPGRVTIRRLNRTEYNHTIADLVGVNFQPADDFPTDDSGYGYDNIADVLSMSPLLTEKYLAAAEKILDRAIITQPATPTTTKRYLASQMKASVGTGTSSGAHNLFSNGHVQTQHQFSATAEYEIRIHAYGQQAGPDPTRMALQIDGKSVKVFDVKATQRKLGMYTHRVKIKAGRHNVAAAFLNDYYQPKHRDPKQRGDRNLIIQDVVIVGPLGLKPPPPPAMHRRIIFCTPSKTLSHSKCARQIIERFASRAFRRPLTDTQLSRLMRLYDVSRKQGDSFEQSIQFVLQAVLVSPYFLYRVESDPPMPAGKQQKVRSLDDYELASRLSYYLWCSMPDEELFALAKAKKLRHSKVLKTQVKRMLANPKAERMANAFAGQWMELRNLDSIIPDPKQFPTYNEQLKQAMRREGELYFMYMVKNDRPLIELIDSNYTFVNQQLAEHYGMKNIRGHNFRRVVLKDSNRGGVLTMAATLTVTSNPTRTSPVKRGKWILQQILGAAPPPPPPDVPDLSESAPDVGNVSLRERLKQHMADPNCSICHQLMDPMGFSMEHYDAIGRWRDRDGKFPVDDSAKLPDGTKFNGAKGLKKILIARQDQFARNFIKNQLIFALGRGLEYYDRCAIDDICKHVKQNGYRFSAVVEGIVTSDPFTKRLIEEAKP